MITVVKGAVALHHLACYLSKTLLHKHLSLSVPNKTYFLLCVYTLGSVCATSVTDYLPLIVVSQALCRLRCQIHTVHPGRWFHACYLSGNDHVIHYLWRKNKDISTSLKSYPTICNFFTYPKTNFWKVCIHKFLNCCVNMNMYSENRWKEHINISHGIRNTMQIDCLTGIKLLASN